MLRRSLLVAVSLLLAPGLPMQAEEYNHPLFQSIRRADSKMLASLLRQGTPANLRAKDGTSPLMYAALRGSAEHVRLLLQHDADPNAANQAKVTPLVWAVADLQKVELLLEHGAKVNVPTARGNTPLIVAAARADSTAVVELLLKHGAEAKVKNSRGYTALQSAVAAANLATVKLLAAKGAKVDGVGVAADRGSLELTEFLIEHGADPNSGPGRHPLIAALLAQKPEIARLLIQKNVRLDRKLSPGSVSALLLAAYSEVDDPSVLKLLLEKGVNVDAANQDDETALTWARKRGHQHVINLLVEAGAPEGTLRTKEVPSKSIELTKENKEKLLRSSVGKSIALLQLSSDEFLKRRGSCVSCHHQNLPAVAISWARDRGLEVDQASIDRMVDGQLRSWRPRIARAYEVDRPVPVPPRFIGYGLLGFSELGYGRDEVTDAMIWYLAAIQQPDGHWVPGMLRPPMGGAEIVATVLAMRSLQLYPLEGREVDYAERVARARNWLEAAKPRTHQERAFRLLGLGWAGVGREALAGQVAELLTEQREDGGWAQLPGLDSDAWATGQTLVALHVGGGVATDQPAYQRGMEFLLRTQFDDGSWYVRSRTWPFQSHFNSKFPHGKDQWVSAPATAWAAMALTLAIEPDFDKLAHSGEERPAVVLGKNERVDFAKHVRPILQRSCAGCHSGNKPKGGYRITTREELLQGGDTGEPAARAKNSKESPLLRFVADEVEDMEMPPISQRKKFPALNAQEVELLKTWIEQGATWAKGVVLKEKK